MAKAVSIEDHFRQIEEAISSLEDGALPLEQALHRYEAGLKAVRLAKGQLDQYATRLAELQAGPGESTSAP